MAEYLASRGLDVNVSDGLGQRPLHIAAVSGNASLVATLIHRGEMTQMMLIVIFDISEPDTYMIFRVEKRCSYNETIPSTLQGLLACMTNVCAQWIQAFISPGARPRLQDAEGSTALHWCARYGHSHVLNVLLQPCAGTDAHVPNAYLDTAMHVACYGGWLEVSGKRRYDQSGLMRLFCGRTYGGAPMV